MERSCQDRQDANECDLTVNVLSKLSKKTFACVINGLQRGEREERGLVLVVFEEIEKQSHGKLRMGSLEMVEEIWDIVFVEKRTC